MSKKMNTFNSERIYWAVEQAEQEAGDIDNLHLDDNLFYIKSEVDKVIAELKDKLQAANEQIENLINSASGIMLAQDRVNDDKCAELRHSNYKRCLAMATWCALAKQFKDTEWYEKWINKWHKRWLEFAEKFKEVE